MANAIRSFLSPKAGSMNDLHLSGQEDRTWSMSCT